jgi:hypothetical protein
MKVGKAPLGAVLVEINRTELMKPDWQEGVSSERGGKLLPKIVMITGSGADVHYVIVYAGQVFFDSPLPELRVRSFLQALVNLLKVHTIACRPLHACPPLSLCVCACACSRRAWRCMCLALTAHAGSICVLGAAASRTRVQLLFMVRHETHPRD